jgi:hypothetical protein
MRAPYTLLGVGAHGEDRQENDGETAHGGDCRSVKYKIFKGEGVHANSRMALIQGATFFMAAACGAARPMKYPMPWVAPLDVDR